MSIIPDLVCLIWWHLLTSFDLTSGVKQLHVFGHWFHLRNKTQENLKMLANTEFDIWREEVPCLVLFCFNSCRCDAVETERSNSGNISINFSCLGDVWDIWLYSAVICLKCVFAPIHHSFSMGEISSNFEQVTYLLLVFLFKHLWFLTYLCLILFALYCNLWLQLKDLKYRSK